MLVLIRSVCVMSLALLSSTPVLADDEAQLIDAINHYRSQIHHCADGVSHELPALVGDPRLQLPASTPVDLQQALGRTAYPMVNAQAISLNGPRDAQAAMQVVQDSFCQVVLDPQYVEVGVSHQGRDWRIVLARPLLTSRLGNSPAEGQKLVGLINQARAQARRCGAQAFPATGPLTWNTALASAADGHSRAMAQLKFFDHKGRDGSTPGDRAELAGYTGSAIGENIAAGQDTPVKVLEGWLASPGHCANLMNPQFRDLGAGYAADSKSEAGIYWTALFGGI